MGNPSLSEKLISCKACACNMYKTIYSLLLNRHFHPSRLISPITIIPIKRRCALWVTMPTGKQGAISDLSCFLPLLSVCAFSVCFCVCTYLKNLFQLVISVRFPLHKSYCPLEDFLPALGLPVVLN